MGGSRGDPVFPCLSLPSSQLLETTAYLGSWSSPLQTWFTYHISMMFLFLLISVLLIRLANPDNTGHSSLLRWVLNLTCRAPFAFFFLVAKLCPTLLCSHGLKPTRLLCPWDFPTKKTTVGCHFLLQGVFPTQGLHLHLLLGR